MVKVGKLCVEVTPNDKIAWISEDLCIGCGICVKVRLGNRHRLAASAGAGAEPWRSTGTATPAAPPSRCLLLPPGHLPAVLRVLSSCRCRRCRRRTGVAAGVAASDQAAALDCCR